MVGMNAEWRDKKKHDMDNYKVTWFSRHGNNENH
jgi:hypothetical protein